MKISEAITALSQSEKIKAGIQWLTQDIALLEGLPQAEKPGADRIIRANLHMLHNELTLAIKLVDEAVWKDAEKAMNKALVMSNSGAPGEVSYHLTQALSRVTTVGQRAMTLLREEKLI